MTRTNRSFNNRTELAAEYTGDYFTLRVIDYWRLGYQNSKGKREARNVLTAFAMMNYIFLMDLVIKHLYLHLGEIVAGHKKSPETSITYQIGYISLIELGQRILESIMPKTSYNPERPLPIVEGKTFVRRVSGYTKEECSELRVQFKDVIRKLYKHLDSKTKCSLNRGGRLWIDRDETELFVPLDEYLSMCDVCNKKVCSCDEETPSASAQDSESLQVLATEIRTATISFGEQAVKIAHVLLENGVSQLSQLFLLKPSEFESLVQKLQLNTIQVQKIREVSGRL
jgi:hypothetical protein